MFCLEVFPVAVHKENSQDYFSEPLFSFQVMLGVNNEANMSECVANLA